ncbi:MAG: SH3-like domain-containing protein [Acidobacteria bacterium]|nr:SH3-like domain-containing protein [Acidobacteriota bacterium]
MLLLASGVPATGCLFFDEAPIDEGIIRSEQADVYSSTALVSLTVASVKRGDQVDILRRESVQGPTYTESWLQVRLRDDAETSGWIEARHVVSQSIVSRTAEIAGSEETMPALARGRLKVSQRLRLGVGRDTDVAAVLTRGTVFDIIGKESSTFKPERTATAAGADASRDETATEEDAGEPEEQVDVWYRVRLDDGSIVRGGWLLSRSVNIEVPDEILHLEGDGRRFVAWQSIGTVVDPKLAAQNPETATRHHYVTYMRRGSTPEDVDFEWVYAVFWDVDSHVYYSPFRDTELRGVFPLAMRKDGSRTIVTVHVLDARNQPVPVDYETWTDEKGRFSLRRVTPPVTGEKIGRR